MPYCPHCGAEVSDGTKFCPICGRAMTSAPAASGVAAVRRTEGTAIASMVLGIVGLLGCPVIGPILALVFGNQAKKKIASDPNLDGEGMAQAGIIMGWIGLAVSVVMIIVFIAALGSADQIGEF